MTPMPRSLAVPTRRLAAFVAAFVFVVATLALPAAATAREEVVALLPPTGDNVAPALLGAARDIIKDHLQRAGVYTVIEPAVPPPTAEPTAAEAAQAAASVGADVALVLRLTHFGNSARLRLTSYAAGTGQVVYWDSLLITGGPDELDTAIQRLVHGMQTGRPVRDSAEIDTVTGKETQNLGRREANRSFGVHFLMLLPFNTVGGSLDGLPAGGLFWLYDARTWMADVAFDIGAHDGHSLYDATIGAYYPLLREDFTPYAGAVVRWAYMNLGGGGSSGLTFQPTAGLLLGRLSSVQVRGDVGYFFNSFSERDAAGVARYGHGFVFTLGLGF